MDRRESIKTLALAALAAGFTWTGADVETARGAVDAARKAATPFEPKFFTPHELKTVETLVDLIIPADERSGSATDVGVPEFMDFMMIDRPAMQVPMRGGLAWIDTFSRRLHGRPFVELTDAERRGVLDQIAYPEQAAPELSHGVAFFSHFRDLTATGFWSSQTGVEDLQYIGNTYVHQWEGCPPEVLAHLGVRYDD